MIEYVVPYDNIRDMKTQVMNSEKDGFRDTSTAERGREVSLRVLKGSRDWKRHLLSLVYRLAPGTWARIVLLPLSGKCSNIINYLPLYFKSNVA